MCADDDDNDERQTATTTNDFQFLFFFLRNCVLMMLMRLHSVAHCWMTKQKHNSSIFSWSKKIRRMRTTREKGEKRRKWLVRQMLQLLIIMNWTINAIVWMRSMLLFSIYILFFISHIICCRRVNYLLVDVFVRVCVRRCRVRYAVRSIDLSESMLRISHSSRMHAEEPMKSRKN